MFKLQHLIRERTEALAESITREQVRGGGRDGGRGSMWKATNLERNVLVAAERKEGGRDGGKEEED